MLPVKSGSNEIDSGRVDQLPIELLSQLPLHDWLAVRAEEQNMGEKSQSIECRRSTSWRIGDTDERGRLFAAGVGIPRRRNVLKEHN
jgi:hypothetical protein